MIPRRKVLIASSFNYSTIDRDEISLRLFCGEISNCCREKTPRFITAFYISIPSISITDVSYWKREIRGLLKFMPSWMKNNFLFSIHNVGNTKPDDVFEIWERTTRRLHRDTPRWIWRNLVEAARNCKSWESRNYELKKKLSHVR